MRIAVVEVEMIKKMVITILFIILDKLCITMQMNMEKQLVRTLLLEVQFFL